MADFVCIHGVNCISEYSKVKLERNYVQLFYCQPLNCLGTTHLIRLADYYVPPTEGGGHIVFGAVPVGVGVRVRVASFLRDIF